MFITPRLWMILLTIIGMNLNVVAAQDPANQSQSKAADSEPVPVRVMSFNIRYGTANDGDNHWEKRKSYVTATIKNFNPDVFGTQETLDFQKDYLIHELEKYSYVGRARQADGQGEHCGIFFLTTRFDKLAEGFFWLSEMPDQPGSQSWDTSLPRMATWLKLWDRENKRSFYFLNTHFDHIGKIARTESAKLIRRFVDQLPADSDVIVTGDFNADAGSDPYDSLFFNGSSSNCKLFDTFAELNKTATSESKKTTGTFNGFKGTDSGARIDWIGATQGWQIESAAIDKTSFDGKFPSDHFPVNAVLRFR